MSIRLTFSVSGDVQFDREIMRTSEHASDLRRVFGHIADRMEGWERSQFESEGNRASHGWSPIKQATIERKQRAGLDTRVLHATHLLRDALTRSQAPGAVRQINRRSMTFGVDADKVPYARFHQHGTRSMPRRRPLELTKHDREEVVRDLQRWITRGDLRP